MRPLARWYQSNVCHELSKYGKSSVLIPFASRSGYAGRRGTPIYLNLSVASEGIGHTTLVSTPPGRYGSTVPTSFSRALPEQRRVELQLRC